MVKKNKFGVIRAMVGQARRLELALNKRDRRLGYIIQSHEFFVWDNEQEFDQYIFRCLLRLLPAARRTPRVRKDDGLYLNPAL